jgi:parallel beta-helix repeat protein
MNRKPLFLIVVVLIIGGISCPTFQVQRAEASGTIYIRANGLVEGTDKIITADNVTYTFTDNINDSIVVERDNIVVDGVGYILQGTGSGKGIDLSGRSNVTIKNMEIMFQRTPLTYWDGIYLLYSYNNSISRNNITAGDCGLKLQYSSNNTISGNSISNNGYGIYLFDSFNNIISGNNISGNGYDMNGCGIDFVYSSNNTISRNNITHNGYGIYLYESSNNNSIYHNNFINNLLQVYSSESINIWDDGAGKGNYWSDFEERYPNATEIDGSGVWDTPYVIDENNQDNYPIVPEFPSFLILPLFVIAALLAVIVYRRKHITSSRRQFHSIL